MFLFPEGDQEQAVPPQEPSGPAGCYKQQRARSDISTPVTCTSATAGSGRNKYQQLRRTINLNVSDMVKVQNLDIIGSIYGQMCTKFIGFGLRFLRDFREETLTSTIY